MLQWCFPFHFFSLSSRFFINIFLGSEKLYVIRVFTNKNQFEGFGYNFFCKLNSYLLKWCHIPLNNQATTSYTIPSSKKKKNIIHNDRKNIGNK